MGEGEEKKSLMEYQYNVPWFVKIDHRKDHLTVRFHCCRNSDIPWSVQCAFQIQIVHPSGKTISKEGEKVYEEAIGSGWSEFIKWEEMKKEYLVGDQLTVVVNVTINQMTGIS
uniref:MATH domain-containing protein n=1 Tax=Caenorhabditis tropicalis TaxID=1561998 RepID=A0A1I7UTV4_9PELO